MPAPQLPAAASLGAKLAWFAALWVASVVGLGIVAFAIKMALR